MENGIGELLFQMRTEAGLSQGQVCHHLCSVPQYARLEADQITIEVFLLDRIFGRMGKSTERLEYVLPREIFEENAIEDIERNRKRILETELINEKEECAHCLIKYFCGGGCRAEEQDGKLCEYNCGYYDFALRYYAERMAEK